MRLILPEKGKAIIFFGSECSTTQENGMGHLLGAGKGMVYCGRGAAESACEHGKITPREGGNTYSRQYVASMPRERICLFLV